MALGRCISAFRSSALVLGLVACDNTRAAAPQGETAASSESGSQTSTAPPASSARSDEAVERFLKVLALGDFIAARRMERMLSREQLTATWTAQTNGLGALQSIQIVQRSTQADTDVRTVRVRFEQGELDGLFALSTDTQQITAMKLTALRGSAPPAAYVEPSSFKTQEVKVGSAPYLLSGALALPLAPGRHPGLVLVHDSGPGDRDKTVKANRPFKDLAEGLASRGIAVLRYNKRTFEYGAQLPAWISVEDEVLHDAIQAVRLLRGWLEIDPSRVFVLGLGLGAQLAPEIALRAKPVAGAVLLAPSGRAPWDAELEQLRYLGAPENQLAPAERQAQLLAAGQVEGADMLGIPASHWLDLASHDGVAMAQRLQKPILILSAQHDSGGADKDTAIWRKGLASTTGVAIEQMDGVNHLFIASTGKTGLDEYTVPGHVDGRVIDRIATFVSAASRGSRTAGR